MAFKHHKMLTWVKIGLEVLYMLAIVGSIFMIVDEFGQNKIEPGTDQDNGNICPNNHCRVIT